MIKSKDEDVWVAICRNAVQIYSYCRHHGYSFGMSGKFSETAMPFTEFQYWMQYYKCNEKMMVKHIKNMNKWRDANARQT